MSNFFNIEVDGKDITEKLAARLIEISLNDNRGHDADDLTIRLDDVAGDLELPEPGQILRVHLGDDITGKIFKGVFAIDEIEDGGPPDYIQISATSADFTKELKVKKERFFEGKTIGEIAEFIAGEHDLDSVTSEALAGVMIEHITQTNESDLNLLSRIAKDAGGFFALKNMTLVFSDEAAGKSASGQSLPVYNLDRGETQNFRATTTSRKNDFVGVKAAWHDLAASEKTWELVGEDGKVKALQELYGDADFAKRAATAELARLKRGAMKMSIDLSHGDASIIPERPLKASGFKPNIEAAEWIIESVSHVINKSGFLTSFALETKK